MRARTVEVKELTAFLESITTGVRRAPAVAPDVRLTMWNRKAEDMWGVRADEAVGPSLFDLDIGLPMSAVEPSFRLALGGEATPPEVSVEAVHRRGRTFVCRVGSSPLRDADGRVGGRSCSWRATETSVSAPDASGAVSGLPIEEDPRQAEWAERWRRDLLGREEEARSAAERARRDLAFLSHAGELLSSSLDLEATAANVAALAVPAVADWCIVDVLEEGGLRQIGAAHVDPGRLELVAELRRRFPPNEGHSLMRVLETGEPELAVELTDEDLRTRAASAEHLELLRAIGIRSHVVVPLVARSQILGTLSLVYGDSGRSYGEPELRLAEELARRCAAAIDNARLYEQARIAAARLQENMALLDTLLDSAPVGFAFLDPERRFVRVNAAFAAMSGQAPEDHRGRSLREILPDAADRLEDLLGRVAEHGAPVTDVDVTLELPDGARHLRLGSYPVRDQAGGLLGVGLVAGDVTEQRRHDRRLAAQYEVQQILSDARGVSEAGPAFLAAIGRTFGWDRGALWVVSPDRKVLRPAATWAAQDPEPAASRFDQLTAESEYASGEGLPGRVWATRRPLWAPEAVAEVASPRTIAAAEQGLRAAVALPVAFQGQVLGVLEFFARSIPHPDLPIMMATMGADIGHYLVREAAEEERTRLLERERAARGEAERAWEDLAFLAEASAALAESFDYQSTLEVVARLATSRIADYCLVDILEEDGQIRRLAAANRDPDRADLAARMRAYRPVYERPRHPVIRAIRSGRPVLVPVVDDDLVSNMASDEGNAEVFRAMGVRSIIAVPLRTRGDALGAISFLSADPDRRYGPSDLSLAEDLARRAALAIDNARLYESELSERHAAERAAERIGALQRVTSSLAECLTAVDVAVAMIDQGCAITGAGAAWIALLDEDDGRLVRLGSVGYDDELQREFADVSIGAALPPAEAARTGRPVFLSSFDEVVERYPSLRRLEQRAGRGALVALPLVAEGHSLGAMMLQFDGSRRMDREERAFLRSLAQQCGQALERTRLYERERAAREDAESAQHRLRFLLDATTVLGGTLDFAGTLEGLGRLAVSSLADLCLIDLVQEDGSIERAVALHADPRLQPLVDRLRSDYPPEANGPHPAAQVIRTGFPMSAPTMTDAFMEGTTRDREHLRVTRLLGFRSYMCVPLSAHGRILGSITFVSTRPGRSYGPAHLALAEELAGRAALSVDNARLYRERDYVARTLQQSLLPPELPEIPNVELAARYHPAGEGNEVGGDFYDVFATDDGGWGLVLGDVRGKGADAAAVMGLVRHTTRAAAMQQRRPSAVLRILNEAMRQQATEERFATVVYTRLRPAATGARLTVCAGGHPLPVVLRREGRVETVGRPGMLLGLFESPVLFDERTDLRPGDALVLYTDGLTEERRGAEFFGEERLLAAVRSGLGASAEALADRLQGAVQEFGGGSFRDDVAILVVRIPERGAGSIPRTSD